MPESRHISTSIILPVFNEAQLLGKTLEQLSSNLRECDRVEIIVSDGGSDDGSLEIARQFPCRIVKSDRGRARQMNNGSQQARGKRLIFLHADSQLPVNWQDQLLRPGEWGFFPVELSNPNWLLNLIANSINLRSRISKVATGDQGLFFDRSFFNRIGGFPDIPIMEDIAICKQARRVAKPLIARKPVITSSRRWQQNGITKTILLMWGLRLAYFLGINPDRLHRIYYPG